MSEEKKLSDYSPYKKVMLNDDIKLKPPKKKSKVIKANKKGRPFFDRILETIFVFFMTVKKIYLILMFVSLILLVGGIIILPFIWKIVFALVFNLFYAAVLLFFKRKNNRIYTKAKENNIGEKEVVIKESNIDEKEDIIKELNKYFKNVRFDRESGIDKAEVFKSNIVSNGKIIEASNYIKAEYNDVEFENSDVKIYNNNKKNWFLSRIKKEKVSTSLESIQYFFKGQWIIFHKDFGSENSFYIWTNNFKFQNIENCLNEDFIKITTKNEEFNEGFILYAKSKVGLSHIIAPASIDELKNFTLNQRKKFPDFEIAVAYKNKKLQISFNIEVSGIREQIRFIMELSDIFLGN